MEAPSNGGDRALVGEGRRRRDRRRDLGVARGLLDKGLGIAGLCLGRQESLLAEAEEHARQAAVSALQLREGAEERRRKPA